MLLTGFARFA